MTGFLRVLPAANKQNPCAGAGSRQHAWNLPAWHHQPSSIYVSSSITSLTRLVAPIKKPSGAPTADQLGVLLLRSTRHCSRRRPPPPTTPPRLTRLWKTKDKNQIYVVISISDHVQRGTVRTARRSPCSPETSRDDLRSYAARTRTRPRHARKRVDIKLGTHAPFPGRRTHTPPRNGLAGRTLCVCHGSEPIESW
jgi:hypothetical protein